MARMSYPHLKCCINVGVREAPCKNPSASLQAIGPPQKSSKCPFVFGEGGAGSENLIKCTYFTPKFHHQCLKSPFSCKFHLKITPKSLHYLKITPKSHQFNLKINSKSPLPQNHHIYYY